MTTPEVNSPESFGIFPADPGYDTFETDFPLGGAMDPAPHDFQDSLLSRATDLSWPYSRSYDSVMGEAWKLRGEGEDAEADRLLADYGLVPETFGDGK